MLTSDISYELFKEHSVTGRYVTLDRIGEYIQKTSDKFPVSVLGKSVEQKNIPAMTLGHGSKKILLWSQMHGNESTTTKAVLDLVNFLRLDSEIKESILASCTIKIVPILNPDGAEAYSRVNANEVDLNRDAQERSQPESRALRGVYDAFQPDFCFNLHDQRTIYNVGGSDKPATVSFLAPAQDVERSITKNRADSMKLIVAMNKSLQQVIPDQIGRYDDSFNINCVGDTFQSLGTPTILFEAGHFKGDYQREETRKYIFQALLSGIKAIGDNALDKYNMDDYFSIPENNKLFFDLLIKNAHLLNPNYKKSEDIGILYKEILSGDTIMFEPHIEMSGGLNNYFGHTEYDCSREEDFIKLKNDDSILKVLV